MWTNHTTGWRRPSCCGNCLFACAKKRERERESVDWEAENWGKFEDIVEFRWGGRRWLREYGGRLRAESQYWDAPRPIFRPGILPRLPIWASLGPIPASTGPICQSPLNIRGIYPSGLGSTLLLSDRGSSNDSAGNADGGADWLRVKLGWWLIIWHVKRLC